jgi:hypothetical protein
MLSLTTFGAVPNDSSQSVRAANAAAWLAAMKAMGTAQAPKATTLLILGGEFYFPGPVFMTRGCIIHGEGGSVNSVSRLLFPYNGAGIVADWNTSPDGPGRASWGKVENLDIINEGPSSIVQRRLNWKYTPGDIVISPGNSNLIFKCTVGGATIEPPSRFDNANINDTIQEANGTTWLALPEAKLTISVWQPNTQYEVGDIVVSNGFDLASQHYGDSRFTYVCTAPGRSGGKDPFGSQALDTHTEVKELNGPTWRINVWSAILMRSSIHVDNVSTSRWLNAAIHINAPLRAANANNFVLTNIKSTNDGMGIYVFGDNANVGFIGYCQVLGPGSFTPGLGGHGFWDHSLSGCLWINNYAEDGSGAGWINDSSGKTTWINNLSEMPVPNIVRQGAVTSLGPSPWHPTMLQQLSHFDLHNGRMISTTDSTSRVTGFTKRGFHGFVDIFSTTDDQGDFIGRIYNFDTWRRGWYTDHLFGQNSSFIGGVSGLMAAEGPGHPWTAAGTFVGHYTKKRYFGYDPNMWMSNRLREGKRIVGDIFITEPYAGPGNWMGIVVTKTGTKGVPWQPNQQYNQKRVGAWNLPAEIVEPGDGFAYACTRSGNSGTYPNPPHKPPFTQHTTIGVNAPVWSANSRYWPGSKVRPTTANGHYYQMKQYPAWTANTPISPNQIITPGDSNGNLFFAYVQKWSKGRSVRLGTRMQPTSPNGKVFRVKRVTGNLASFGSTGAQEPNWSLLVQPTDELPDGSVVWQLDQLMTGTNEPPGDNPQYAGWDTRPGGISYDNNIKWRFFVPKTGRTEPNWNTISGSETVDTPNAQVKSDGSVEDGFGVVWVESGPDPADSKVSDNECEWTRIDTVPAVAKVLPVGAANGPLLVETMSLTLNRLSLTNIDDTAGRWQYEGGEVFRENTHIANYASTKRVVIKGTEVQNTAMLTLTLFFVGQPRQPAENMTLQGSHDFGSGDEIGSVSAASTAFASYIGKQFKRSGTALVIQ